MSAEGSRGPHPQVRRLARDYAAWAAHCYTILTKRGDYVTLHLNAIQQAIGTAEADYLKRKGHARLYVLKARQPGVSTDQQARSLHLVWRKKGATALTLADNDKNRDKIFLVTRRALDHFPPALLPEMGERETREVGFTKRDSHFWTETAGSKTAGRAITLWRLHGSEFAHWDNPRQLLGAATPALVPQDSVVVLETTGGGYDSDAHNYWREARKHANGYHALFFPWWRCDPPHYQRPLEAPDELGQLQEDERLLMAQHGLVLPQIKWRREQMAQMGRGEFLQEYAEDEDSCWLTVGERYFDLGLITPLRARAPQPVSTELDGTLERYGEPGHREMVVIGADTAEGVDGDRSAWSARGMDGWRQLSTFASAHVTPEAFADLLAPEGRRFHGAFLVIEKNMHGITVLRRLRDVHQYPEHLLYHRAPPDEGTPSPSGKMGWATSAQSIPLMLAAGRELLQAAQQGTAGVPTSAVLQDAAAVKRAQDGRVKLTGRDLLVADMLAWIGRAEAVRASTSGLAGVAIISDEQRSGWEVE